MEDKISVYGATGFIGSNFIKTFKNQCITIPRHDRIPKTDSILYLISTTHNYHVFDDIHKDVDTNLRVLTEMLDKCRDSDATINFVSSWFVYGDTQLPAHEDSYCNPKGFYSITKYCAEQLVESYCKTFNKRYRIIRLSNVYGTGDGGASKKKNALQYLVERLKKDEPIDLYHGGRFYRDYLHVNDVCRAIKLVMEKGEVNQIYNVGSGNPYMFRDLIDYVIDKTGSRSKINETDAPDFHKIVQVKNMYLNIDKLRSLGFEPNFSIDKGLDELCQI
jgi:nucleoside-diphosphate-sugar epimerase